MLVPFQQLPDSCRIWLFQSDRTLSPVECTAAAERLSGFLSEWTAHQQELMASFDFRENRFVVIAVNEAATAASGCSLDKLHQTVRALGQELGVDFFNRMLVTERGPQGDVKVYSLQEASQRIEQGELKPETLVFDTTISTVGDYRHVFVKPLGSTWLSRYQKVQ
jgi:hypothetical protein